MRRKVWIAVFGLLVLAVIAQSLTFVRRRAPNDEVTFRMGSNGRVNKIRNNTQFRFTADPENFVTVETEPMKPAADIDKMREAIRKKEALWTASVVSSRLPMPVAEDEAMEMAQTKIMHDLQLSRPLPREFISNRMIANRIVERGPTVEGIADTNVVTLDLRLTPDTWQLIAENERDTRIRNRMGALGAFVAVATIFFGCVAGYVRIDEATKGYYSGRLKVAAIAIVCIAAAGAAAMID